MKITVRYFAAIREAVGPGSELMDTHATTLAQLRDELIARGAPWARHWATSLPACARAARWRFFRR